MLTDDKIIYAAKIYVGEPWCKLKGNALFTKWFKFICIYNK